MNHFSIKFLFLFLFSSFHSFLPFLLHLFLHSHHILPHLFFSCHLLFFTYMNEKMVLIFFLYFVFCFFSTLSTLFLFLILFFLLLFLLHFYLLLLFFSSLSYSSSLSFYFFFFFSFFYLFLYLLQFCLLLFLILFLLFPFLLLFLLYFPFHLYILFRCTVASLCVRPSVRPLVWNAFSQMTARRILCRVFGLVSLTSPHGLHGHQCSKS